MEQIQITKMRTAKQIIEENKNNLKMEMFWNYDDSLSERDIIKILTEENGLDEVENEIWENNIDYMGEMEMEKLKEILTEEEMENEDLKQEVRDSLEFDFNMGQLIKNSSIHIRLELNTNEDLILFTDKKNDTLKQFRRVFKGKYSKADYDKELLNLMGTEYGKITFYFKVSGNAILTLRQQIQEGYIQLRKGLQFGFFNSCSGSGSLLEMELKGDIKLMVKDWRYKNDKEKAMAKLKGEGGDTYYDVSILGDNISKYGINETYGLCGSAWKDF